MGDLQQGGLEVSNCFYLAISESRGKLTKLSNISKLNTEQAIAWKSMTSKSAYIGLYSC